MPPPTIANGIITPHAAPATAGSDLPMTDTVIIRPVKQTPIATAAISASGRFAIRTPSASDANTIRKAMTTMHIRKQPSALPASIWVWVRGATRSRSSVPWARSRTSVIAIATATPIRPQTIADGNVTSNALDGRLPRSRETSENVTWPSPSAFPGPSSSTSVSMSSMNFDSDPMNVDSTVRCTAPSSEAPSISDRARSISRLNFSLSRNVSATPPNTVCIKMPRRKPFSVVRDGSMPTSSGGWSPPPPPNIANGAAP